MRRLVVFLLALALLAACGDDNESSTSTAPPTSPAPTTTTTTTRPQQSATPTTLAPDLETARVALDEVASGLQSPVALAWRKGDTRMYVAEQGGRVRVVGASGAVAPEPVLTVAVSGGNEQGLLGLAFSPDGTKLYVDYTDPSGDTHVDEYTMRGDVADTGTRREVLFQEQPFPNHNGGEVIFGPDGMLYIGFGDGGGGGDPDGNAQDLGALLGKILRVNPRARGGAPYSVPADNPFVGREGAHGEVWMHGLRNPWRFSFDRATGDVWIGDVGQQEYEEVDFAPAAGAAGANWGWNLREGKHPYEGGEQPPDGRDPVTETTHPDNCAIVGGYVYRGRAIPRLRGAYVFGDNCNPTLTALTQRDGRVGVQRDIGELGNVTTFGEDHEGELYVASRNGSVYRFAAG